MILVSQWVSFWVATSFSERDMTMSKEAEDNRKYEHYRTGDIGSAAVVARLAADESDYDGQGCGGQDHAAGIDAEATNPFLEIVSAGLEDKPLISKEGEADAEQIR